MYYNSGIGHSFTALSPKNISDPVNTSEELKHVIKKEPLPSSGPKAERQHTSAAYSHAHRRQIASFTLSLLERLVKLYFKEQFLLLADD